MSAQDVAILARVAGLSIDPDHLPGVMRNLDILIAQAALFMEPPLDPLIEPAPVYCP